MAYNTTLANGVRVTSKDVKMTRGKVLRQHTVYGSPLGAVVVWEDRLLGRAMTYVAGQHVFTDYTLSAAYRRVV